MAGVQDDSINAVLKRADDFLRVSKKQGRDRMCGDGVATSDQTPRLAFFAQGIQAAAAEKATAWGAELLLREYDQAAARWLLPKRFDISVEQQIALIAAALKHTPVPRVTLNLTLGQFSDPATADALAGFATAPYGPGELIVEITTVPDLNTIRRVTARYRDAGIRVFIDDVGSDNSYELVQRILPYIDGVKFAMQNLRRHESLGRIRERVAFWAAVAQKAAITFVLEGVETAADVQYGQQLGVAYFQGYFFGKPALPA